MSGGAGATTTASATTAASAQVQCLSMPINWLYTGSVPKRAANDAPASAQSAEKTQYFHDWMQTLAGVTNKSANTLKKLTEDVRKATKAKVVTAFRHGMATAVAQNDAAKAHIGSSNDDWPTMAAALGKWVESVDTTEGDVRAFYQSMVAVCERSRVGIAQSVADEVLTEHHIVLCKDLTFAPPTKASNIPKSLVSGEKQCGTTSFATNDLYQNCARFLRNMRMNASRRIPPINDLNMVRMSGTAKQPNNSRATKGSRSPVVISMSKGGKAAGSVDAAASPGGAAGHTIATGAAATVAAAAMNASTAAVSAPSTASTAAAVPMVCNTTPSSSLHSARTSCSPYPARHILSNMN